jgi:capsular exopolysaccharide synthesis family protein
MDRYPLDPNGPDSRVGRNFPTEPVGAQTIVLRGDPALAQLDYGDSDRQVNFWDYVHVIRRRRWTVLSIFGVSVLAALVFCMATTPLYRATALLQIRPAGPHVTDFDSVQQSVGQAQAYSDFYQTQYEILGSRSLARRTVQRLNLEQYPYLNGDAARATLLGRSKTWIAGWLATGGGDSAEGLALEREQRIIDTFLDNVEVEPRKKSFLVELSYWAPDAEVARDVADTMSHEYIDLSLDQSVEAAAQARRFIEKQVAKIKAALERSEEQLHQFARDLNIHAIEQEERVIHQRLADLNSRLTEAESHRITMETLQEQAEGPRRAALGLVVNNPLLKTLHESLAQYVAERAELGARFTSEYPMVAAADARISNIRGSILLEENRVVASIGSDYARALGRESSLRTELEYQKSVVAEYEEKAVAFNIHRREVDTNQHIYDDLLRRMKEVEVTEAIRASNISLVDPPEVPIDADSPRLALSLALALIVGLAGGVGFAFAQEYVDDSLTTPDDVERFLRLPTLGTIPEFESALADNQDDDATPDMEVLQQPTSAGSEAIRTLRASLFLAAAGGLPNRLLLTSARPNEGKTCIAVNLAMALAQMGRRVVLLDCDLRRPRVNKALGMDLSPGLTNLLTENSRLDDIVRVSAQPGLDIITAGPIPPNPVDLLDSAHMQTLLRDLEERYDHVLVDAPPALGFSDVPIITNQLGGGCLLVARAGETPRRVAQQACDYLIRMQSKLLGVVLNRVSARRVGYSYYGYYSSYSDYYTRREEDELLTGSDDRAA